RFTTGRIHTRVSAVLSNRPRHDRYDHQGEPAEIEDRDCGVIEGAQQGDRRAFALYQMIDHDGQKWVRQASDVDRTVALRLKDGLLDRAGDQSRELVLAGNDPGVAPDRTRLGPKALEDETWVSAMSARNLPLVDKPAQRRVSSIALVAASIEKCSRR